MVYSTLTWRLIAFNTTLLGSGELFIEAASREFSVEFEGTVVTAHLNPKEPVPCTAILTSLSLQYCSVVPFATKNYFKGIILTLK